MAPDLTQTFRCVKFEFEGSARFIWLLTGPRCCRSQQINYWLMQNQLPPIHTIRRQRVMLDSDLARLYGVRTSQLNQAIKRNVDRFPEDFRFQLTREEYANLISQFAISSSESPDKQLNALNSSQIVTSSRKHRGGAYLPWAFTEHGALMAATVLKSPRAVQMSLFVVRAFVQMREDDARSAEMAWRSAA